MSQGQWSSFSGRDLAAVTVVVTIWGLNFVAIKVGLKDFTPFQLGAARFLFSFLPLALWVRPPPIGAFWLTIYGLLQGVGQFGALFFALKVGMPAALAPVMMQMQVFVTALLGALLLGEKISRPLLIGMGLAGLGLTCFAINAVAPAGVGAVTVVGMTLNLLAASMWAGSNIVVRRLQTTGVKFEVLSLIVWSSAVSAAGFLLLSAIFDDPNALWGWTDASAAGWLSVLYLSWLANLLAYWLWTSLLARHPASRVAPFSLGLPVVGLIAGMALLGEKVSGMQWIGTAFVMSALVFVLGIGSGKARFRPNADNRT